MNTLRRVWAVAFLALVIVTHRLWLPVGMTGVDFPQVASFSISPGAAFIVDALAIILAVVGLVGGIWRHESRRPRWSFAILAISLGILFATNQHRLQPWAYQGWIYSLIFALASPTAARRFLVALAVSVYAYSALGKFDAQFVHTVGPDFVSVLPSILRGGDAGADQEDLGGVVRSAVLAMPVVELGIAFFVALPKTRRIAGMAAVAMHGVLLGILGPWGLGHSGGVLLWNVFLAIQAWLLFVRPVVVGVTGETVRDGTKASDVASPGGPRVRSNRTDFAVGSLVVMAIVMPLFERSPRNETYGYWDHWLSWSLYSPHTSRVAIQVHGSQVESLPPGARPFAHRSADDDGWFDLRIDRWSLAELSVPVYPQARFQLGVAHEIARGLGSPSAVRIKIRGVSDRRTGERKETWAIGLSEIRRQVRRHWFLPDR